MVLSYGRSDRDLGSKGVRADGDYPKGPKDPITGYSVLG